MKTMSPLDIYKKTSKKHDISENRVKPAKQQHFDLSGLNQGSPNISKNTHRSSQNRPRTLPENNLRFLCPLGSPQGPPRTPKDDPRDPQGSPRTSLGTANDLLRPHIHVLGPPKGPPRTSTRPCEPPKDPKGPSQTLPRDPKGPPKEPKGPPKVPPRTPQYPPRPLRGALGPRKSPRVLSRAL